MVVQVVSRSRLGAGLCAITGALVLSGCLAEQPAADVDAAEAGLASAWVPCAKQGEQCAFKDTRRVRYGAGDRSVVKSFSNGVFCDGKSFGARRRSNATCAFEASAAPATPPTMTGSSGSPAPAPVPSAGTHAGHAGASAGPYIDVTAIPMGSPGSSSLKLGTSSEAPGGSDGTGAFRTVCGYSHMLFDDPLVFPSQPGKAHLHAFFGNTDTDAYSTQSSTRSSGNSTCRGGIANRSAYWVPALLDAAGKPVKPNGMDVYYKSGYNGITPAQIQKFPSGLRVIAGSAKSSAAQQRAYWGCHANYIGHPGSIPQCRAGDQLVMIVELPQCWDGKNLDSADHVSHMSYTAGGRCPSSHPVAIPAITFNVLYPVRDVKGWRLASDMYGSDKPGGFSAHADWFEGWDPAISKTFVERCIQRGVDCHSHLLGDGRTIE